MLPGDMQHDRPRLEQREIAFLISRDLPERLPSGDRSKAVMMGFMASLRAITLSSQGRTDAAGTDNARLFRTWVPRQRRLTLPLAGRVDENVLRSKAIEAGWGSS
jgi:hypothetical protein